MKIVSYWKDLEEVHNDDGLVFIIGRYDHKNENNGGFKALGVHWGDYPKSHNVLSPCVIPESTRDAILSGLLHKAIMDKKHSEIDAIRGAEVVNQTNMKKIWTSISKKQIWTSKNGHPFLI